MTEQLDVTPKHRVLEVGTGSGYQAAVLSRLAREVVTLERYRTLANSARGAAEDARLRQCRGAARRRLRRRADARALRPHHRHGGGREHSAGAGRRSWPTAASWCCRSVRTTARSELVKLTKTGQGVDAREPDRGALRAAAAGAGARIVTAELATICHEFRRRLIRVEESFILKRLFTRALLTSRSSCCVRVGNPMRRVVEPGRSLRCVAPRRSGDDFGRCGQLQLRHPSLRMTIRSDRKRRRPPQRGDRLGRRRQQAAIAERAAAAAADTRRRRQRAPVAAGAPAGQTGSAHEPSHPRQPRAAAARAGTGRAAPPSRCSRARPSTAW